MEVKQEDIDKIVEAMSLLNNKFLDKIKEDGFCLTAKQLKPKFYTKGDAEIRFSRFKSDLGNGIYENSSLDDYFCDIAAQRNENNEENWLNNRQQELTDLAISGLSFPGFFDKELKEPRFENYFRVRTDVRCGDANYGSRSQDESVYYRNQFYYFYILFCYITTN